jgi:hypothetical protein
MLQNEHAFRFGEFDGKILPVRSKHPRIIGLLSKKPAKLVAVAVANKMARIAWAIMVKEDTIERRSLLLPPEEAWQWRRGATTEQGNRIARVDGVMRSRRTAGWDDPFLGHGRQSPCS